MILETLDTTLTLNYQVITQTITQNLLNGTIIPKNSNELANPLPKILKYPFKLKILLNS